jgi:hypothetical protein
MENIDQRQEISYSLVVVPMITISLVPALRSVFRARFQGHYYRFSEYQFQCIIGKILDNRRPRILTPDFYLQPLTVWTWFSEARSYRCRASSFQTNNFIYRISLINILYWINLLALPYYTFFFECQVSLDGNEIVYLKINTRKTIWQKYLC